MFNRQMKRYKLEIPVVKMDDYNQSIITYEYDREVEMALAVDAMKFYSGNSAQVINVDLISLAKDPFITKGDRIDGKYIVTFVEPNRLYTIVHMKEIDNNGRL